jgi:hypothetical protein
MFIQLIRPVRCVIVTRRRDLTLKASVKQKQVIDTKPAWPRKKKPEQNHEIKDFGKIQKFREPTQQRWRFNISNRSRGERDNHHATEHHASNGRQRAKDQKESKDKFNCRNNKSVEIGKQNTRLDQRLAHLFTTLRHEEFAAPGKKEKETDCDPRQENSEPLPRVQLSKEYSDR